MFLVKVECRDVSVEKLAESLLPVAKWFKVWLYKNEVHATFIVDSLHFLQSLRINLEAKKVKFRFYRIEEINHER